MYNFKLNFETRRLIEPGKVSVKSSSFIFTFINSLFQKVMILITRLVSSVYTWIKVRVKV